MKKYLFLMAISLVFQLTTKAQSNIKSELKSIIKIMDDYKDQIPDYWTFINKYDQIAAGINGHYETAARRISNGYTLVKRNKVVKNHKDIESGVKYYEAKGENLYHEIGNAIDEARDSNAFKHQLGEGGLILGSVAALIGIVERLLKASACRQATEFYSEVRWLSSEEILTKNRKEPDWGNILGWGCN